MCYNKVMAKKAKRGFTIVEVSLVLAVTGLLLIGTIRGLSGSVARQRYNDTVQDFYDFLTNIYSKVANPSISSDSLDATGDSGGTSEDTVILGELVSFTIDGDIRSATVFNDDHVTNFEKISLSGSGDDINIYTPVWDGEIQSTASDGQPFQGSLLVTRSVNGDSIRTYYNSSANSTNMNDNLGRFKTSSLTTSGELNFCVYSDDLSSAGGIRRNIRINANAHNASAVSLVSVDSEDNLCAK